MEQKGTKPVDPVRKLATKVARLERLRGQVVLYSGAIGLALVIVFGVTFLSLPGKIADALKNEATVKAVKAAETAANESAAGAATASRNAGASASQADQERARAAGSAKSAADFVDVLQRGVLAAGVVDAAGAKSSSTGRAFQSSWIAVDHQYQILFDKDALKGKPAVC